eukprot:sb/3462305/
MIYWDGAQHEVQQFDIGTTVNSLDPSIITSNMLFVSLLLLGYSVHCSTAAAGLQFRIVPTGVIPSNKTRSTIIGVILASTPDGKWGVVNGSSSHPAFAHVVCVNNGGSFGEDLENLEIFNEASFRRFRSLAILANETAEKISFTVNNVRLPKSTYYYDFANYADFAYDITDITRDMLNDLTRYVTVICDYYDEDGDGYSIEVLDQGDLGKISPFGISIANVNDWVLAPICIERSLSGERKQQTADIICQKSGFTSAATFGVLSSFILFRSHLLKLYVMLLRKKFGGFVCGNHATEACTRYMNVSVGCSVQDALVVNCSTNELPAKYTNISSVEQHYVKHYGNFITQGVVSAFPAGFSTQRRILCATGVTQSLGDQLCQKLNKDNGNSRASLISTHYEADYKAPVAFLRDSTIMSLSCPAGSTALEDCGVNINDTSCYHDNILVLSCVRRPDKWLPSKIRLLSNPGGANSKVKPWKKDGRVEGIVVMDIQLNKITVTGTVVATPDLLKDRDTLDKICREAGYKLGKSVKLEEVAKRVGNVTNPRAVLSASGLINHNLAGASLVEQIVCPPTGTGLSGCEILPTKCELYGVWYNWWHPTLNDLYRAGRTQSLCMMILPLCHEQVERYEGDGWWCEDTDRSVEDALWLSCSDWLDVVRGAGIVLNEATQFLQIQTSSERGSGHQVRLTFRDAGSNVVGSIKILFKTVENRQQNLDGLQEHHPLHDISQLDPKTKQVWWIAGAAEIKNRAKVLIHELSGPGVLLNSRFHDSQFIK